MSVEIQKDELNNTDLKLMNEHAKLVYSYLYGPLKETGVHISFLQMVDSFLYYSFSTIIFIVLFFSIIGMPLIASVWENMYNLHEKIYKRLQKKGTYSNRIEKTLEFNKKLEKQFPENYWIITKIEKIPFVMSLAQAQDFSVAKRLDKYRIPFNYREFKITSDQISNAQKKLGIKHDNYITLNDIQFSASNIQPNAYNFTIKSSRIIPEYWKTEYGKILLNKINEKKTKHHIFYQPWGPDAGNLTGLIAGSKLTNYFQETNDYSIIPA